VKKIVALTAVLLVLVFSMGSGITGTHRACASDIVSKVTGETATPVPPIADADGSYSCYVHETLLLDGSGSYDPDGTIIKYEWNFGDETTGTGEKPSHTYSSTGTFTVTLTVTDNHDLTDDDITTVEVISRPTPPPPPPPPPPNKMPKADAGPNQKVWVNRTILFSGAGSHDEDGIIISYNWDFSDGRMALGVDVSHVYSEPGHHTVTLIVKDDRYGEDSDTCIVKVYEVPAPFVGELSELVPAGKKGHVVNASKEANTTITLNTTSRVTVTVLKYERNPYPEDPINATTVPLYADVMVSISEAVEWPIYVEMFYTDEEVEGLNESSLGIYYWFNGTWRSCSDTGVDIERNVAWAYMTSEEEASGSPILVGGTLAPPLPPILSNLTITPEEVEIGNNVTIGVDIENIDSQSFTYNFTMQIGELTLLVDVKLESYESKTVKRTITPSFVGLYDVQVDGLVGIFEVKTLPKPAEFEVSDLTIVPVKVEPGEEVDINFTVTNIGELPGDYSFTIGIAGPLLVVSKEMTGSLEAGESEVASYMLTEDVPGTYSVEVDGLKDSFEVKIIPSAGFVLSNLTITPSKIEFGEEITVSFIIRNADSRPFVYVPHVQIGEITIMDYVELEGHESKVIVHTINQETAGDFEVEVDGLTGSYTVKPRWMRPENIVWIIFVIIVAATILYAGWKGKIPNMHPEIDDEI